VRARLPRSAAGLALAWTLTPLLTGLLAPLVGCSHPPPDATPEGAVRAFLDDMETATDDPRVMPRVYDRLGPVARANLEERARRTSQLQGRQVSAWEMLAAGRFGIAFRPKSMRASIVGDRATVEVLGANPATERASVDCVYERRETKEAPRTSDDPDPAAAGADHDRREPGGWRIEPKLPGP
jgi:hypothetical protein